VGLLPEVGDSLSGARGATPKSLGGVDVGVQWLQQRVPGCASSFYQLLRPRAHRMHVATRVTSRAERVRSKLL
jgi:hypothetical protein